MVVRLHERYDLPLPTDVVEWCRHPAALRLLAVGSYELDESIGERRGQLQLFYLEPTQGAENRHLKRLKSVDLPGVFDLRWDPSTHNAWPHLAAALADGSVRVMAIQWNPDSDCSALDECKLVSQCTTAVKDSCASSMAVSLDYSRCSSCVGQQLVVSYSCGQLQLLQVAPAGLVSICDWQAHTLEAWVAAMDEWHPSLIHSGGDDCAYRLWDSRQGGTTPVWQDRRAHGAGVCCASSSPHQHHVVCTGSYDDRLRLWDLRNCRRPLLAAQVNVGGGGWRAKWHPTQHSTLLAACMYNGFAILRADGAAGQLEVLESFEHQAGSLSYGADWCGMACDDAACESLAATCTFYDRRLQLWSWAPACSQPLLPCAADGRVGRRLEA